MSLTLLKKQTAPITLSLLVCAMACECLLCYFYNILPKPVTILANGLLIGNVFLHLAHEAYHGSMHHNKIVNDSLGLICNLIATPLGVFPIVRFLHFNHHRHTRNHHDMDNWLLTGNTPILIVKWLFVDLFYVYVFFVKLKGINRYYLLSALFYGMILFTAIGWILMQNTLQPLLFYWMISSRLGLLYFSFFSIYLVHSPALTQGNAGVLKATVIRPNKWLTALSTCQNYHLIHHLYPAIPFYKLSNVWQSQKEQLIKKGAIVINGLKV